MQPLDLLSEAGYDSRPFFLEVTALAPGQVKKTQQGLEWLLRHGLDSHAVIVGGMAVAFHAAPRPLTPDLDLVVENLAPFQQALAADGITQVSPITAQEPAGGSGVHVAPFDTDLLVLTDRRLTKAIFATAVPGRLGNGTFRFVSAPMLAVFKVLTGRAKDMTDAFTVIAKLQQSGQAPALKQLARQLAKDRVIDREQYDDIVNMIF
jgi:hypothetical protein